MPEIDQSPPDDELSTAELLGWLEFSCWTTLALAPFLYWVNGPAVSRDQFLVRTILVTLALIGAVSLRLRQVIGSYRARSDRNPHPS